MVVVDGRSAADGSLPDPRDGRKRCRPPTGADPATRTPMLHAVGLGRRLPAGGDRPARWIWRGLDLDLHPGESLAVTGPSGTGKTLLLRALAGLDPLDEGTVYLEGRPQAAWAAPLYRARVLYVAQRPALFDGTVADNLARPFTLAVRRGRAGARGKEGGWNGEARPGGRQGRAFALGMALAARIGWGEGRSRVVEPGFDRERALELLAALGRDAGFLQQPVTALSGGEAQITALVRALLVEPQVLLLDEPTASLDPATARAAEALVARWREAGGGRACIWTSHDRDQLRRVAHREVALAPAGGPLRRGGL